MKIIPFRIEASKEEDNYSDVYAFLIQGTTKDAYEVEIDIDSLNDKGITDTRCTCPHYMFRALECKHIIEAKKILVEFKIETTNINKANNQQGEMARIRKEDSTNKIGDVPPPQSSLAINGDGNPADSHTVHKTHYEVEA